MNKTYATLALKQEGPHVLVVTLNRPEVLNAISTQMGRDWLDLFNGLAADPGELRCLVLTGAGDRAFCAGADRKERDGMSVETWRTQHAQFEMAFVAVLPLHGIARRRSPHGAGFANVEAPVRPPGQAVEKWGG